MNPLLHILKVIFIIFEVLVIFNLMIIVHELGHFLAARWRGLVIEKFGIWFGKPLWKKKINGVEYSLGSIPAGGFVALPQLAPMEVMEGAVETPREQLPPISVLDKIIVAFAGPLFSFLLAVVFAIIVWQVGRPVREAESTTVIGSVIPDMPAAKAKLQPGDKILSIDGHEVKRFSGMSADSIQWSIARSEGPTVQIVVEREVDGVKKPIPASVEPEVPEKANWWNRKNLRTIGILPKVSLLVAKIEPNSPAAHDGLQKDDIIEAIDGEKLYDAEGLYLYGKSHPADHYQLTVKRSGAEIQLPYTPLGIRVAGVEPESPASAAGLRSGDVILEMDGQPVRLMTQLIDYVGGHAAVPIKFQVRRGPAPLNLAGKIAAAVRGLFAGSPAPAPEKIETVTVTPQIPEASPLDPEKKAKIGFLPAPADGIAFEDMGISSPIYPKPVEQVRLSVMAIINTLDAVMSRKSSVSVQHMGGPVMMMNAYYHMLSSPDGLKLAIWFSVVLNVNLALLNLLPIPVLDGGHITLAIIEGIRRKPMNVRVLEYVQTACALVIIGFMLFIMFFDVQDLPFMGGDKRASLHFKKPTEEPAK